MYRIRFHGRGGQGMKTAGRMLGSAFFHEGFEVQDAPRYGAERRGAPIFAYVRADRVPISERGIIRRPDLVVVADDSLVPIPAAGVLTGLSGRCVLLIDTHESAETWRRRLSLEAPIIALPAPADTADPTQLPFVGAACAGAAARLVGVIGAAALERAISDEVGHFGAEIVAQNLERAFQAYDQMAAHAGCVAPREEESAADWERPAWVDLPVEEARVAAPVIHGALTSEAAQTGLWRTMRPVVDYGRCNRCWWVCSTFCPDGAITVDADGSPRIDYAHCKGCLVCVAQCPPHAIAAVPEHEAAAAAGESP
ncbi:MAG: 2-oxoacid:acceptor oxidoreductase family protein [Gammaproteobacteria bacterium]|jgi:pyruvate ferredoxin oxidoreductase gamma subunit|nr:2-oxoacid:acceptor oxidoreductase family protein [Gammaproteobacteria bacterium]